MIISVEKASNDHITAISQLDLKVLGSSIRAEYLQKSVAEDKVWVATTDGSVLGFVVINESFFGNAFIQLLIVEQDSRRQGIGSLLIKKIESISPTYKLFTSTNESNKAMQRLCESLGFIRSGYIENLDEGDPEIVYFKQLER